MQCIGMRGDLRLFGRLPVLWNRVFARGMSTAAGIVLETVCFSTTPCFSKHMFGEMLVTYSQSWAMVPISSPSGSCSSDFHRHDLRDGEAYHMIELFDWWFIIQCLTGHENQNHSLARGKKSIGPRGGSEVTRIRKQIREMYVYIYIMKR